MLTDHARLLRFFMEAKKVTGRKKMQKMIYILQVNGIPFEEKYQFHFYGPYSEELSLRIEELCNLGFIYEKEEDKGNYTQFTYELTEDGNHFLHQFHLNMPDFHDQVSLLQKQSARFLELVATMLYFRDLSQQNVEKKVRDVKPKQNYTDEEMKEAWDFIEKIKTN